MNARRMSGLTGVILALGAVVALAQHEPAKHEPSKHEPGKHEPAKGGAMDMHHEHDSMMQDCAKACGDCQRACDQCATHCAHKLGEGMKEHATTLATCRDCATICSACAEICARGGPFANWIVDACAKACADCGAACEKFPSDDHMKRCAEECRRCEKTCRSMMNHLPGK